MKKSKKMNSNKKLSLPEKGYGPASNKILKAFIAYHNLPKCPLPEGKCSVHEGLSMILDIMLHSMGKENREEHISQVEEYKESLPTQLDLFLQSF
jgi:hypothetical protein